MAKHEISVLKSKVEGGWLFQVKVSEADGSISEHQVTLREGDYQRLTAERVDPERLVEESFRFLLEHEPKEAILGRFDLMAISRYFPEYEEEVKRRLRGPP
ncbi:MAG: hypothetical protein NUW06_07870 [Candidatus Acetothermia bacterium]|jgi:hypothetical protein|nr:hypothetical protein [Candidatus Acetothermia bacterium]MDH7505951.1 hypothetical protein [Candidatus Acetothermia bacterium]